MARIYPSNRSYVYSKAPISEMRAYDELRKLSKDFVILYSVPRTIARREKHFLWYENDFIIIHKKYGMLFLEIKGGEIRFENGMVYQKNRRTNEEKQLLDDDPLNQANKGIQYFRNLLNRKFSGIEEKWSFEPVVWFPDIRNIPYEKLPEVYKPRKFAILNELAFEEKSGVSLEEKIISIFKNYNADKKQGITDDELERIIEMIAPELDLVPSMSSIKSDLDYAFIRLTNEQQGLLDYIQEQNVCTIQGVAGTGKTQIAKEAAKRFSAEGRKVLFLCVTTLLCNQLRSSFPDDNIDYYTMPGFVSKITNKKVADRKQTLDELKKCIDLLIDNFTYDDIIIDEAQDFFNDEIIALKTLCELKDDPNWHFFVFYDKNQVVLTEGVPQWIKDSECRLVLTKNCRNSYEIAKTAYNVIDTEINQRISDIKGDIPKVLFSKNNSLSDLAEIINYYKSEEGGLYQDNEITILTLKTENTSILKDANQICGIRLAKTTPDDKSVFFTTARRFKGLESKVIIVVDIDETSFSDTEQKRDFYVACSRATHSLVLFVDGHKENINKISDAIISDSHAQGKGRILFKTQTKEFTKC